MKRVSFVSSNGFVGVEHRKEVVYSDEEFEDMTEEELYELADEFAQEYVEAWYEVEDV